MVFRMDSWHNIEMTRRSKAILAVVIATVVSAFLFVAAESRIDIRPYSGPDDPSENLLWSINYQGYDHYDFVDENFGSYDPSVGHPCYSPIWKNPDPRGGLIQKEDLSKVPHPQWVQDPHPEWEGISEHRKRINKHSYDSFRTIIRNLGLPSVAMTRSVHSCNNVIILAYSVGPEKSEFDGEMTVGKCERYPDSAIISISGKHVDISCPLRLPQ